MKTFLIFVLTLIASIASAQLKIGEITLDQHEMSGYILDCYYHPDTVYGYDKPEFVILSWVPDSSEKRINLLNSYRKVGPRAEVSWKHIYLVPRKPSDRDYIMYKARITRARMLSIPHDDK